VVSFGAFVELEPGIEGLLHVRQLPGTARDDPNDVIAEGEAHLLRILDIDAERRRIRLSMRAVKPEEQMEWMAAHAEKAPALMEEIIGLAELIDEEE
jgi:ribosomal protein S1